MKSFFLPTLVLSFLLLSGCAPMFDNTLAPPAPSESASTRTDFGSISRTYRFSGQLPEGMAVEYVSDIDSINVYATEAEGESVREKSQIFIRHFRANTFLTLSTVDILEKTEKKIGNHDAIAYRIKKKESVADFADQPSWRNEEHTVLDIRFADTNPSDFYVFSYHPSLDEKVFTDFVESLWFHNDADTFSEPVDYAADRVTKKPFGIYVAPGDSPIDEERFKGFHTGIDFEISKEEDYKPVPVYAICSGELVGKQQASGYGGVLVQRCQIDEEPVTVVYGHVIIDQVRHLNGEYVSAGEQITVLGEGYSEETDGERKHLHLSIHKGNNIDLRGYVNKEADLSGWIDPSFVIR